MAKSNRKEMEILRASYVAKVCEMFNELGEEVLPVASNRIAFPAVGADGGEYFVTVTVAIPTGERNGEPYDGYAEAEGYKLKLAEKAEIAKEKAKKKKEKGK